MPYLEIAVVIALTLVNGALAMAELRRRLVFARRACEPRRSAEFPARAPPSSSPPIPDLSLRRSIGITLIGVLSGAFSGATLGARLSEWIASRGLSPAMSETLGVGLVVAAITYVSLIVGEPCPSRSLCAIPNEIAAAVAPVMSVPVPATSIFSRTDGVVHWRNSVLRETARAENIEILLASHTGSAFTRRCCGLWRTGWRSRKDISRRSTARDLSPSPIRRAALSDAMRREARVGPKNRENPPEPIGGDAMVAAR